MSRAFPRGTLPRWPPPAKRRSPSSQLRKVKGQESRAAVTPAVSLGFAAPQLPRFPSLPGASSVLGLVLRTGELWDRIGTKRVLLFTEKRHFSPRLPSQGAKRAAKTLPRGGAGAPGVHLARGFGVLGWDLQRDISRGAGWLSGGEQPICFPRNPLPCTPLAEPCLGDTSPPALG